MKVRNNQFETLFPECNFKFYRMGLSVINWSDGKKSKIKQIAFKSNAKISAHNECVHMYVILKL